MGGVRIMVHRLMQMMMCQRNGKDNQTKSKKTKKKSKWKITKITIRMAQMTHNITIYLLDKNHTANWFGVFVRTSVCVCASDVSVCNARRSNGW